MVLESNHTIDPVGFKLSEFMDKSQVIDFLNHLDKTGLGVGNGLAESFLDADDAEEGGENVARFMDLLSTVVVDGLIEQTKLKVVGRVGDEGGETEKLEKKIENLKRITSLASAFYFELQRVLSLR